MTVNTDPTQSPVKLGAFGRDVSESVTQIIDHAYENAEQILKAKLSIPEGYVHLPEGYAHLLNEQTIMIKKNSTIQDKLCTALSAALPAAMSAVGIALNASEVAIILLAGGGGIAGTFLTFMQKRNCTVPIHLEPLHEDDISVQLVTDEEKLINARQESIQELERLERRISTFETNADNMHDIQLDRRFGEWVQKFIAYIENHPDDQEIQTLYSLFIPRLAAMGIKVYDDVQLKDDGTLDVPFQDYLIDSRNGDEYTEVVRPAIYSDKGILARGEIR